MHAARVLVAAALAAALAGCSSPWDVCGERPAGGGPPVIVTRDQEVCDLVRLRVQRTLRADPELDVARAQVLINAALAWERLDSVESLLDRVREDAGEATAEDIRRAVDWVVANSARPIRPECGEENRCLARGAAKGARIAYEDAEYFLARTEPAIRTEHGPVQVGE